MLEDIYNYLCLTENLSTSGQPREEQLVEIARAGFQVVINLLPAFSEDALADEATSVLKLGMAYVHIPVIWEQPTLQNLKTFIAVMDANQEQRIFLHCAANMRVSAFMALYRIIKLRWEPNRAFADMQRIWKPNPVWQRFIQEALENSSLA